MKKILLGLIALSFIACEDKKEEKTVTLEELKREAVKTADEALLSAQNAYQLTTGLDDSITINNKKPSETLQTLIADVNIVKKNAEKADTVEKASSAKSKAEKLKKEAETISENIKKVTVPVL